MIPTVAPAPAVRHTTDQPTDQPYHRLAHDPRRWWRPLLVLTVAAGLYLVGAVLASVPLVIAGAAVPGLEESVERASRRRTWRTR